MTTLPVVGYCRVSTVAQAAHGVSLDAQRDRIEKWAAANGQLDQVFSDEGISGKSIENRPGLKAAIERAIAIKGVLVGYSLSRLFRSAREAEEVALKLRDSGSRLVSLTESIDTETAIGRMMFNMLSALAQFERELIVERTQAAMQHKRENGERIGRYAPIGFCFQNGRVVPEPNEQRGLEIIRRMYDSGEGLKAIQRRLRDECIFGRTSEVWSLSTIRLFLVKEMGYRVPKRGTVRVDRRPVAV